MRTGVYMMGWDYTLEMRLGVKTHAVRPLPRAEPDHQLLPDEGRALVLAAAAAGRPPLARPAARLGREDLLDDERWTNIVMRRENAASLVEELDGEFAKRTLDEWGPILDAHNVWWAPVNTITQALAGSGRAGGRRVHARSQGPDGPVPMRHHAGRLLRHAGRRRGPAAGARPAHRGSAAGAGLRLGRDHRAEGVGAIP